MTRATIPALALALTLAPVPTQAEESVPYDPFAPDWESVTKSVSLGQAAMCAKIGDVLAEMAQDGVARRPGTTWEEHTKDVAAFLTFTDRLMTLSAKHCDAGSGKK